MDPIVVNLSAENPVHEMTSICMECFREGATKLMLTKIPYFKEVIISSFDCENCGNSNNSVQPASGIADTGIKYTLNVTNENDLNRQVIKSEYATITIPDIELEIPPESQKGSSSTVEGFLSKTKEGILQQQDARRETYPEVAAQLDNFMTKIDDLLSVCTPFTFILTDPSGNSFVENPRAPKEDPQLKSENYTRGKADEDLLGITSIRESIQREALNNNEVENTPVIHNENTDVMTFEAVCNACGKDALCNMKQVDIPFFKTILLMANVCDHCGFKDSEVKSAGGIAEKGQRTLLEITDPSMDLVRDILKSETAVLKIPELDLSMTSGCLGGRFTTVEGLLEQVKEQLMSINPFSFGDSSVENSNDMKNVVSGLESIIKGEKLVSIILEDPAGNSFIQNLYAPDDDPHLKITYYERSDEDDEELGIKYMKTENY